MGEELIDIKLTEKDEEQQKRSIDFEGILEKNKLTVGFLLAGLILIGLGVLGVRVFNFENGPRVEILGESEDREQITEDGLRMTDDRKQKIAVEVAGEVEKPGVYSLEIGSRINDLLTAAGGLSAEADREWVAKNINLAQKLVDGAKIFVPKKDELCVVGCESGMGSGGEEIANKININIASESELDTLWGIGPATAKKIIEGRPYQKPEELLEKKIVRKDVWEKIKDKITVY